jgi:hypothetical protein
MPDGERVRRVRREVRPPRRRQLLASGDLDGWVAAQVPGPMLLEVQRQAARQLISMAELVRSALMEKFERERKRDARK